MFTEDLYTSPWNMLYISILDYKRCDFGCWLWGSFLWADNEKNIFQIFVFQCDSL